MSTLHKVGPKLLEQGPLQVHRLAERVAKILLLVKCMAVFSSEEHLISCQKVPQSASRTLPVRFVKMKNPRILPFQNEEHNKEPYRKVYDAVSIGPSPIGWSISWALHNRPNHFGSLTFSVYVHRS